MNSIVYTGSITKHHEWALDYLKGYDVFFIHDNKNYRNAISDADICLSIVPHYHIGNTECIIPIKLFDYIEQRKKILHFVPDMYGESYNFFSQYLSTDGVFTMGDQQSAVDEFIKNGTTDYSRYNNEFHIDTQYEKLKSLIESMT
jgi:hypothetical protein